MIGNRSSSSPPAQTQQSADSFARTQIVFGRQQLSRPLLSKLMKGVTVQGPDGPDEPEMTRFVQVSETFWKQMIVWVEEME